MTPRPCHGTRRAASLAILIGAALVVSCDRRANEAEKHATATASAPPRSLAPSATPSSAPAGSAAPAAKDEKRPPLNVLLITIDSLRADVPWHGYARPIAPYLTKLAEQSVVYTRAYSASSYTAKSVATMLSGRYASTLYRDRRFFARYAPSNEFLAELLAPHGIRSVAWHGHMYFGRNSGFEQGFDEWRLVPGIKFDAETDNDVTSDKMTALGIELLGKPENTGVRFFAWAHYMDPHDQYLKHAGAPEFGKKARDRYDSEIWFADHWIGKLLDWAKQQPFWKNTAVIVSADHGEAFGEHEMYKHAFELWEVLTRVPLFVYAPGVQARRIEMRRSHIDLAPTMLELMGVPIPAGFQGKSMVPELFGAEPESREPILTELAEDSHNPPRRALISGNLKLIAFERNRFELYDLSADPGETRDLSRSAPKDLERMKAALKARYESLPVIAPFGGGKLREGGKADGPTGPEG